jgi:raffinose/stachyose/melibiose transport system substrate-binding protein
MIDQAVADFTEEQGVTLEAVSMQGDAYKTKLKVAMGAGDPPDIFSNWGGGPLKTYVDAGMVMPLPQEAIDTLLQRYIKSSFDPVNFDGQTYGAAYSGLTGVYFWYRQDIFEDHGVTVPKTWSEFVEVCRILKEGGVTPIELSNKSKWPSSFYYMYISDRLGGASLFSEAISRGGRTFEDEVYVRTGEMIQDLVEMEAFPKGFNGMDYDSGQGRIMFYSGRAAMTLMGDWHYGIHKAESPETADYVDFFSFPEIEGGAGHPSNLIGSPGQDWFSVASTSENSEAALAFLTDYVMNADWVQFLIDNGRIPPVNGAAEMVTDPIVTKNARMFEQANHVQLYWDQFLPPSLGETHKDLVQALFAMSITPQEMATEHQEALEKHLAEQE